MQDVDEHCSSMRIMPAFGFGGALEVLYSRVHRMVLSDVVQLRDVLARESIDFFGPVLQNRQATVDN